MSKKMPDNIHNIVEQIQISLLDYEPGDLFFLSDLIDNIEELRLLLDNNKCAENVIKNLLSLLESLINGNPVQNEHDLIVNGIDLLTSCIKKSDENDKSLLEDDINQFINKIPENIKNARLKIKPAKTTDKQQKNTETNEDFQLLESDSFKVFIAELNEKIVIIQDFILQLENDLNNQEIINNLFRVFHTIKGECGFLKLSKLGEFTHNLENLLDIIRNHERKADEFIIDILLKGLDIISDMAKELGNKNIENYNNIDIENTVITIKNICEATKTPIGKILKKVSHLKDKDIKKIAKKQKKIGYTKKFGEIAVSENYVKKEDIKKSLELQKISSNKNISKDFENDQIIKVKASQINYLVDMIGELIISQNQLEEGVASNFKKITKQVQYAAMQLRTIKVKNLFLNMKRVVRDLCKKLNKEIEFEIKGEELEIDRTYVENLEEPLVHILRNAVSHGIESKNERKKKHKNENGNILLMAERLGNNIIISIKDDGKGLDTEAILKKAVEKKLINKEQLNSMREEEIFSLIFTPGFSTAEKIDNVSGRGVGMDVVQSTINKLRGKINISSIKNQFTKIELIFPLSMAIIDGMIVQVRDSNFIIPVSNIIESLKLEDNMIRPIENKESVINLRGEIIPVINLQKYFNLSTANIQDNNGLAVIVENHNRKYGLLVDKLVAKKEIVIKSLGNKFKNLKGISSGTVLTEGKIGFVLNIDDVVTT